jgi:hypothetical protein
VSDVDAGIDIDTGDDEFDSSDEIAPTAVAVGKAGAHGVQDGLERADRLTFHQSARVFQRLADFFATGHFTKTGVPGVVADDDDVAGEERRVSAREVEQHAVASRDRDDSHGHDNRGRRSTHKEPETIEEKGSHPMRRETGSAEEPKTAL